MEFDSAIRGHHIYKEIWPNPNIGEQLYCKMENGNIHDMYTMGVTRDREDIVVGHLPRNISTPCHLFLRKGGNISCVVNGARRFSADLVQDALEVPCRLVFQGSTRDIDKIRQMLQDAPKEQQKAPEVKQEVQKNEEDQQEAQKNTDKFKEQQRQIPTVIEQPPQCKTDLKKPKEQHEQQISNQNVKGMAELTKQHSTACEDIIVIDDCADINNNDNDIWLKTCKITLFIADRKQLTSIGSPLNDKHINLAQMLLKHQFPKWHGFYSTLLQHKPLKRITAGIQIIHINYHWLTAAKLSSDKPLKVYDSVNLSVTNAMKSILTNIFEFTSIEMATMQKQKEINICGLYAVAVATAIAHDVNPSKLQIK